MTMIDEEYFSKREEMLIGEPFGKVLRVLRRDTDVVIKGLAEASTVSQSYISQLENDVRLPSDKALRKLSEGLAKLYIRKHHVDEYGDELFYPLADKYKQILTEAKRESRRLEPISTDNSMPAKVKVTKQEMKLLDSFREMNDEIQEVFLRLMIEVQK